MRVSDFIRWYITYHLGYSDYVCDDIGYDDEVTHCLDLLSADEFIDEHIVELIKKSLSV